MNSVEERKTFATVVGMQVNAERLGKIAIHNGRGTGAYADCEAYFVETLPAMDKKLRDHFQITDALLERWSREGIWFRICLFMRNGILVGGHIYKYKAVLQSGPFCPTGYSMAPTQQEIRIADRILRYLVEEDV